MEREKMKDALKKIRDNVTRISTNTPTSESVKNLTIGFIDGILEGLNLKNE